MAQITMDSSEWESMKKAEKLLEDSLKREKEMSDKIEKLQKEKIEELKSMEKKVVKIIRNETQEFIIAEPPARQFIETVARYLRGESSTSRKPWNNCYLSLEDYVLRNIMDVFRVVKSQGATTETVTVHGLDDIKAEIKAQYDRGMDDKIAAKLKRAEQLIEENARLAQENIKLTQKSNIDDGMIDELNKAISAANDYNIKVTKILWAALKIVNSLTVFNTVFKLKLLKQKFDEAYQINGIRPSGDGL